jgi:hypothetical protein
VGLHRERFAARQCDRAALGFLLDRAAARTDIHVCCEIHRRGDALVLRDVHELVRDHVTAERAVEIEVIGDGDVRARGERRRLQALRCLRGCTTAVNANVREIETELLRELRRHLAGQRLATRLQRA